MEGRGSLLYHSTSFRLSCCEISTRSERAGRTQRLVGKMVGSSMRNRVDRGRQSGTPGARCARARRAPRPCSAPSDRPPRPSARRSRAAIARRQCSLSRGRAASSPAPMRPPHPNRARQRHHRHQGRHGPRFPNRHTNLRFPSTRRPASSPRDPACGSTAARDRALQGRHGRSSTSPAARSPSPT